MSRTAQRAQLVSVPQRTPPPALAPVLAEVPPACSGTLSVAAATDVGRVRAVNQDAYGYSVAGQLFALCDGMGGAAGGEIASRLTVDTVLERLAANGPQPGILSEPMAATASRTIVRNLEEAVAAANRILCARAEREPALAGMGTTLVALLVRGSRAWVMHVGGSRCYLLRAGTLTRCTEDHSLVGEQVRLGLLSEAEADRSPLRHVITRAVGIREGLRADVSEIAVTPGDTFLLCSDGLTREVSEERIAALLGAAPTVDAGCRALVDEANNQGGRDNITCIAVRLG